MSLAGGDGIIEKSKTPASGCMGRFIKFSPDFGHSHPTFDFVSWLSSSLEVISEPFAGHRKDPDVEHPPHPPIDRM